MPPEPSTHPEESGLVVRTSIGLTSLPEGVSPALSEIISRSLAHIQAGRALAIRYRIGDQELCEPDYQLVCAWAEDLLLPPEEVLRRLLLDQGKCNTRIEDGRFKDLRISGKTLPISFIPSIEGLVVLRLILDELKIISVPDFSMFPNLTELECSGKLTDLDLSHVSYLTELNCGNNQLAELNLSQVPNLKELYCFFNKLVDLDLSQVPYLKELNCGGNKLTKLDLSQFLNLTILDCSRNEITELDIRNLLNLENLDYDKDKTNLIQRPDQNF